MSSNTKNEIKEKKKRTIEPDSNLEIFHILLFIYRRFRLAAIHARNPKVALLYFMSYVQPFVKLLIYFYLTFCPCTLNYHSSFSRARDIVLYYEAEGYTHPAKFLRFGSFRLLVLRRVINAGDPVGRYLFTNLSSLSSHLIL